MPIPYFLVGFLAGAGCLIVALLAFYFHLKRARGKSTPIKGYLDLIPDLTREQRERVQEIRRVFLPKVDGIRQSLCLKRAELADLLFAESVDRTRIYEVAKQIMDYQSELEQEVIEHILEEREILSAEQNRMFYRIILEQFSSGGLGVHDVKARRG